MELSENSLKEFMQVVSAPENALPEMEPSVHFRQMFKSQLEAARHDPVVYSGRIPSLENADESKLQHTLAAVSLIPHPKVYKELLAFVKHTDNPVLKQMAFLAAEHNRDLIESSMFSGNYKFVSQQELPENYFVRIPLDMPDKEPEIDEILENEFELGADELLDWDIADNWLDLYLDLDNPEDIRDYLEGLIANLNEDEALVANTYEIKEDEGK